MTKIDYGTKLWPVATGCWSQSLAPGCVHCWARRLAAGRLKNRRHYRGLTTASGVWTGEIRENEDILRDPYHWKRPQRVAVALTGDLFRATDGFIRKVCRVMEECRRHTFLVLSKCTVSTAGL